MTLPIQLDFFKTPAECEIDSLRQQLVALKISTEKVRKGMYARLNEQGKKMSDLEDRMYIIEKNLCAKFSS